MRKHKLKLIFSRCLLILIALDRLLWPSVLNAVNDPEDASNFTTVSGVIVNVSTTAPNIVIKRDDGQRMAFEFVKSLRSSRERSYVLDPTDQTKWVGKKVTIEYAPVRLDYYQRNRAFFLASDSNVVTKSKIMEKYRLNLNTYHSVDFIADIVGLCFLVFALLSLAKALRNAPTQINR